MKQRRKKIKKLVWLEDSSLFHILGDSSLNHLVLLLPLVGKKFAKDYLYLLQVLEAEIKGLIAKQKND